MAKTIIYPTNENEILSKSITYTKTKDGVTDWNFWSSRGEANIDINSDSKFFYESSLINPTSKLDALLDYRKKKLKHFKILENEKIFTNVDNENQLMAWLASESSVEKAKATSYYELKNAASNWVDIDYLINKFEYRDVEFLNNTLIPKLTKVASNTLFEFDAFNLKGFEFQTSNGKNIFEGIVKIEDSEICLSVHEYIKMPEDIIETKILKDASIKNSNCALN